MPRSDQADWENIGETEPFNGVLTHERFLRANLTPETLEEFYRYGRQDVEYLLHRLSQLYPGMPRPTTVLDFGCGVGRLTRAMCALPAQVTGVDCSAGMLAPSGPSIESRRSGAQ